MLDTGRRAGLAAEGVADDEGHQLPQLEADARLVEPRPAHRAHDLHLAQVAQLAADVGIGIPFDLQSKRKLSPQSYPIECERK